MYTLTKERGPWQVSAEVWDGSGGRRPLVVAMDPVGVTIRQKGRRQGYKVPWVLVWQYGAKLEADRRRAAKLAVKKEKDKARKAAAKLDRKIRRLGIGV